MRALPKPEALTYTPAGGAPYLAYTAFDASPFHRNRLACLVELLGPQPGRVLEIGCGLGNICLPLASLGMEVTATDLHEPSVEAVRNKSTFENLELRCGDFRALDLAAFDSLILTEVLEHVPDHRGMLRDLSTGMKPGARLLITVPNGWGLAELACRPSYVLKRSGLGTRLVKRIKKGLNTRDITTANEQSPHVHFFTRGALASLFEETGLEVLGFRRFFFLWALRETFFSERPAREDRIVRDFERSQRLPPSLAASWAFLLQKPPVAG